MGFYYFSVVVCDEAIKPRWFTYTRFSSRIKNFWWISVCVWGRINIRDFFTDFRALPSLPLKDAMMTRATIHFDHFVMRQHIDFIDSIFLIRQRLLWHYCNIINQYETRQMDTKWKIIVNNFFCFFCWELQGRLVVCNAICTYADDETFVTDDGPGPGGSTRNLLMKWDP